MAVSTNVDVCQDFSYPRKTLEAIVPFATSWFSVPALEKRDVFFRLFLGPYYNSLGMFEPYIRRVFLQACGSLHRDALIEREKNEGKYCQLGTAFASSMSTEKMVLLEAVVTISTTSNPTSMVAGNLVKPFEREFSGINLYNTNLPNQTVSFKAEIALFINPPIVKAISSDQASPAAYSAAGAKAMLGELLGAGVLSDVSLRVDGGEELPAHRCVLAGASRVFRCMFENRTSAESLRGLVEVKGVRPEVMAAALRFLYGQGLGASDLDMLCDLLVLADRYELRHLQQVCDAELSRDSQGDPLQLLTIAVRCGAPRLREAAVQRIVTSPDRKSMLNSAALKDVIKFHPDVMEELILQL